MNNPNENIVQIYRIIKPNPESKETYIDMELLNTKLDGISIEQIKIIMEPVKDFLHSLGIMYIDWKPDNTGIGSDGKLKLFDFDVSGLIDTTSQEWIIRAPTLYYSYKTAVSMGAKTPIEIDNLAFEFGFNE